MQRRYKMVCGAVIGGVLAYGVAAAWALDSFDGVQFLDLSASGELTLGAPYGALAAIDYDNDGWFDLAVGRNQGVTNGRLYHNIPDPQKPGQRTFVDVTAVAGLNDADGARNSNGILAGDYDNDGDTDLFICGFDASTYGLLYRNNADGTFTNVSVASGIRGAGRCDSASSADFDLDGDLDLMLTLNAAPFHRLMVNQGDGTFSPAAGVLPAANITSTPYCHAWSDYDGDGYPDFYGLSRQGVGTEILWHNVSDGAGGRTFVNIASQVGYRAHGPAPMGIAFGDYDNDGDLDIAISDAAIGTFYRRDGANYTKFQPAATMFGWGVNWIDVDNDGDLDFFTAGSHSNPAFDDLRLNNGDGTLTDISEVLNGVSAPTRYSIQMDYNNDGRPDILAVAPNSRLSLYENRSVATGHWASVQLIGDGCRVNMDAANALIRLTAGSATQIREVINGSSTTASEDPRQHFGLGDATVVDQIEVVWPRKGTVATRTEIFPGPFVADQLIVLSPQELPGDANCDGSVNFKDIDVFVTALGNPAAACRFGNVDVNADGVVNFKDIDPFVTTLGGACP